MKPNSDFHFNQMTSSEPFKASGPTMVSITLEEYHSLKEEIERLRQHVRDLDHDLQSALRDDENDGLSESERLGMR